MCTGPVTDCNNSMAKSKNTNSTSSTSRRDINVIASGTLHRPSRPSFVDLSRFSQPFRPIVLHTQDRRFWHPDNVSRPGATFRKAANLSLVPGRKFKYGPSPKSYTPGAERLSDRVGFEDPSRVAICVRRNVRKEVIHALGKAGKGKTRRPKQTEYSKVRC